METEISAILWADLAWEGLLLFSQDLMSQHSRHCSHCS